MAVDSNYRGKRLGLRLIAVIKDIAIVNDCYKITLDCKESNMGFYEQVRVDLRLKGFYI